MKPNRKRNKQIIIRVSNNEYEKISEKIALSKMTMNRFFINAALRKEIVIYDFKNLLELSAQISKVGNNINQIAKKLNQGGFINRDEISFIMNTMEDINQTMMKIYNDISENNLE